MNRTASPTRKAVSQALAELMPLIMRGVQLDFFVKRGVTQTQFLTLSAIRAYDRCTMGALARNLNISMPTMTGIVDRLARAGYLRRLVQAEDRRQVIVELTPKAQSFFQQFLAVMRRRWEQVFRSLNAEELSAFYRVITKLRARLQVNHEPPA